MIGSNIYNTMYLGVKCIQLNQIENSSVINEFYITLQHDLFLVSDEDIER